MSTTDHVFVVDDDTELRSLLREYLQDNGYRVTAVADGKAMWKSLESTRPDLIVLDVMLPGDDGLTLCRDLRAHSEIPVIMLTARGDDTDRIVGLTLGADDYVGKPFNPRELLARIRNVLRRARALPKNRRPATVNTLRFGGWSLHVGARHLLSPDGVVVPLSGVEFRLLRVFLEHPQCILTRDQLLDLTRSRDGAPFDRAIDVQVSRLRQKLREDMREPKLIKTVRAAGYLLSAEVEKTP